VATLLLLGVLAPDAGATLRIVNHNDPAGDPTVITYRIASATWLQDFQLADNDFRSFGPAPDTYTIQAFPPAGWQIGDIQCVSSRLKDFSVDVANGRVTVVHSGEDHDTCSFTNRRVSDAPPSPGIAPAPPAAEVPAGAVPRRPAVLSVVAERRFAEATVRISRRSIIKGRLLTSKGRIVGRARISRKAGTYVLRVSCSRKAARRFRLRGKSDVTLTLRIAVVGRDGATWVFRHRVLMPL